MVPVNEDLVASRPLEVTTRFHLAAARIADGWLRTRKMRVSLADYRLAREFLQRDGWTVQDVPGARVRLTHPGFSGETTREEAVVVALRRLVASGQSLAGRRAPAAPRSAALRAPVCFRVSGRAGTGGDACPAEWRA
jgi:hypothetical protein